jgi:hypothetical protein
MESRSRPSRRFAAALALGTLNLLSPLAPRPAAATPQPSYDFVPVVDDSGPLTLPGGGGALNSRSQVAFQARTTGSDAIYLWDRGRLSIVASLVPGISVFTPDINDLGEVSLLLHQFSGPSSFLKVRHGRVVERVDEDGPLFEDLIGVPLIDNRGGMAIHGVLAGGLEGVFVLRHGRLTTLADSTGPFSYFAPPVDVNERGQVVFTGDPDDLEHATVLLSDGRHTRRVVDASGPFEFFRSASVNNRGDVAVQAYPDGGAPEPSILISDRRGVRVAVPFGGPFLSPDFPLLDNAGRLIFTDTDLGAVFAGLDPVADRILGPGDPLAGSTVVRAAAVDINDAGVLLVVATLEDGRRGLWLALPRGGR